MGTHTLTGFPGLYAGADLLYFYQKFITDSRAWIAEQFLPDDRAAYLQLGALFHMAADRPRQYILLTVAGTVNSILLMAVKSWIEAFRLRTLPLALASVGLGSFVAASNGHHRIQITLLTLLTATLLQILSNLANDYGDYMNGADTSDRIGPRRAVASGDISPRQMKVAIIIFVILCLISGLSLLYMAFYGRLNLRMLGFFILGLLSIGAAIKYTAGKNPYGYRGLGDISVFLFFGPVAVAGTYFLHAGNFLPQVMLPAFAFGLLSTAVLNVNNLRDYTSDRDTGKRTLVVQMGPVKGLQYHRLLVVLAWICLLAYTIFYATYPAEHGLYHCIAPVFATYSTGKATAVQRSAFTHETA